MIKNTSKAINDKEDVLSKLSELKTGDWLNNHSKCMKTLMSLSFKLESLASAFYTTGNELMANKLQKYSSTIFNCQQEASKCVGQSIKEQVNRGQETSALILKSALAGIKLSKGEIK